MGLINWWSNIDKSIKQLLALLIMIVICVLMVVVLIRVYSFDKTCDGCVERGECNRDPIPPGWETGDEVMKGPSYNSNFQAREGEKLETEELSFS